mmetsp:Transcript_1728/g.1183  ORF Transcript_1728/g.1183 Transcript_1728/m.1183 type:complete len:258 (+) Transcript_1728:1030-1803(+)
MVGPFVDVETLVAYRDLMHRLNSDYLDVRVSGPQLSADFRNQYLMNSRITGIDDTDLILLVGSNPKVEAPVLNARIRKSVSVNGLEVALIGSAPNLSYDFLHLGNSPATLKELAHGSHPFFERLSKAELPMIIVGADVLERRDAQGILNLVYELAAKTNLINEKENWNGVNILHKEAARVGALDLGITTQKLAPDHKPKVVYLLGADNFRHEEIPEDAFVIYHGHTGDEGAYYADLIIPGSSYLERSGTFVNTDGRV